MSEARVEPKNTPSEHQPIDAETSGFVDFAQSLKDADDEIRRSGGIQLTLEEFESMKRRAKEKALKLQGDLAGTNDLCNQ